jgi:hypothetical protein
MGRLGTREELIPAGKSGCQALDIDNQVGRQVRHKCTGRKPGHELCGFVREQQLDGISLSGQLQPLHESHRIAGAGAGACGRCHQASAAFLDIHCRHGTRRQLLAQVGTVTAPFIEPGFDVEAMTAGTAGDEHSAPAVIAHRCKGRGLLFERARAAPDQARSQLIVAV